jgi:phosphoenolpyruvate carboxykinase (ATP)
MNFFDILNNLRKNHSDLKENLSREKLIEEVILRKEAFVSESGALATWTPEESTGRSPKDTYIVRDELTQNTVDWDAPNNIAMSSETFKMLTEDALKTFQESDTIFITNRSVGAMSDYALPVTTVSNLALTALFTDNVFRPYPENIEKSCFYKKGFTLLVCPYNKLDPNKYNNHLRVDPETGQTSTMAIAIDFSRNMGVVYGSAYGGSCKKLLFTVMNYLLPFEGILPLHCSANEGKDGRTALMLGLSGTGKTSLSSDPTRSLLGDDEHGWNEKGISNFENGCYAKLINLDPEKEVEIYNAIMTMRKATLHGAIVENAMMYPNGRFDFNDGRLTQNSRASYPLSFLSNIKESSIGGHPKAILFLTADANGVLPPVSRLSRNQAMLWFLLGYTSKLAGTETGIKEPVSTFSRFFGAPFMPRTPDVYAKMLGEKLDKYGTSVYLINTGWSGGPYGKGKRIDINLTRAMVHAAISRELEKIPTQTDDLFHLEIPKSCPGILETKILFPKNTWEDKDAYEKRARKLALEFSSYFDKAYEGKGISEDVICECPGK